MKSKVAHDEPTNSAPGIPRRPGQDKRVIRSDLFQPKCGSRPIRHRGPLTGRPAHWFHGRTPRARVGNVQSQKPSPLEENGCLDSLSPRGAGTAKRNAANCVAAKEELLT